MNLNIYKSCIQTGLLALERFEDNAIYTSRTEMLTVSTDLKVMLMQALNKG